MTSDVTLTGALNNAQKTETASVKLGQDFTQFLKLLTTQLQNQDPLDPMDSAEFTNQLVQFSQVEQAINSNQKLDNLVGMQLASGPSMALNYVGMDIMYRSADINYDAEQPVKIDYALQESASSTRINIFDEKDQLVYSSDAPNGAGTHEIVWNGETNSGSPAPAGTYSVRIDVLDENGESVQTDTVVSGRVRGVEAQNGIAFLLVGERAVSLGNVINASRPAPVTNQQEGT